MLLKQNCTPSFPHIQPCNKSTKFGHHVIWIHITRACDMTSSSGRNNQLNDVMTSMTLEFNTTDYTMTLLERRHDAIGGSPDDISSLAGNVLLPRLFTSLITSLRYTCFRFEILAFLLFIASGESNDSSHVASPGPKCVNKVIC